MGKSFRPLFFRMTFFAKFQQFLNEHTRTLCVFESLKICRRNINYKLLQALLATIVAKPAKTYIILFMYISIKFRVSVYSILLQKRSKYCIVEVVKNLHTRRLDNNWFYSLKVLGAFYIEIIGGFLHVPKQINCLTGAVIARHILRIYI